MMQRLTLELTRAERSHSINTRGGSKKGKPNEASGSMSF
jgi:hypothetical protein